MEQFVNQASEGSRGHLGHRDPPLDAVDSEPDSCIAGPRSPTSDVYHRDAISDVRPFQTFDVFHEIEQFVRNNPWPILALGFLAGYLLARGKER